MSEAHAAALPAQGDTENAVPELGARLRDARRRMGLNLESAAVSAGLSTSHLSRMESGARSPSLPVLLTLARTYATTVSALLGETVTTEQSIIRAEQAQPLHAHGWTYRRTGDPNRTLQALRIQVSAGDDTGPARIHPGEEWLYVLRGTLRLHLDGVMHSLAPGDAAHFDSMTPHRIASCDPEGDVHLLMLHAPPPTSYGLCVGSPFSAEAHQPPSDDDGPAGHGSTTDPDPVSDGDKY